MSESQKHC